VGLELRRPVRIGLRQIAEEMTQESVIVLVSGDRRTGKTTVGRLLAPMAAALGSRIGGRARPWGVDPDGQLGSRFDDVELDGAGRKFLPSWAPKGIYPFKFRGVWLIDEAQENGEGMARRSQMALIRRSGPCGLSGVMTSQRCAELAQACPPAARLFQYLIAGRISFPADAAYLESSLRVDVSGLLDLPLHQFRVYKLGA